MYEKQVQVRKRPTTALVRKLLPPKQLVTRAAEQQVEVGNPIHMANQFIQSNYQISQAKKRNNQVLYTVPSNQLRTSQSAQSIENIK